MWISRQTERDINALLCSYFPSVHENYWRLDIGLNRIHYIIYTTPKRHTEN